MSDIMTRNDRTNRMIMWTVIASDFVLLNIVLLAIGERGLRMLPIFIHCANPPQGSG